MIDPACSGCQGITHTHTCKITMSELSELFGESMPIEAVTILQKDGTTVDEARRALNELAKGLRDPAPEARTSRWRYEIQDGPEGEFKNAEFAQVFDDKGASVGTLKLHHAFLIVGSINNDEVVKIETPPIAPILQREWMAQALFEVDAPDHLEWEDVGIDKRERYLCLADAAIRRNNTCP